MKHQFAIAQRRKDFQMYKIRFGKGKSFLRMAKENFLQSRHNIGNERRIEHIESETTLA